MLAALMAGIPVFAGAHNLEGRTGANTIAATSFPEPAIRNIAGATIAVATAGDTLFAVAYYRPHYRRVLLPKASLLTTLARRRLIDRLPDLN